MVAIGGADRTRHGRMFAFMPLANAGLLWWDGKRLWVGKQAKMRGPIRHHRIALAKKSSRCVVAKATIARRKRRLSAPMTTNVLGPTRRVAARVHPATKHRHRLTAGRSKPDSVIEASKAIAGTAGSLAELRHEANERNSEADQERNQVGGPHAGPPHPLHVDEWGPSDVRR